MIESTNEIKEDDEIKKESSIQQQTRSDLIAGDPVTQRVEQQSTQNVTRNLTSAL